MIIGIIFSDLHLGEYSTFNKDNRRVESHFEVLKTIKSLCRKYNVPGICTGDLFHKPDSVSNDFYETIVDHFKVLDKHDWKLYCISGNHDCQQSNSINNTSPSWVKSFSKIFKFLECMDLRNIELDVHNTKFNLCGIPYIDHNINLNLFINKVYQSKGKSILLLHTDYPGAKDTDGTEVGTVENLNLTLLDKFRLVLCGHIHKPQRLSKKAFMIGAPLQQRRTDRECELGYWELHDDFSMVFKPLDSFPKFIDVNNEDGISDDINYYTIIPTAKEEDTVVNHGITQTITKTKMVKKYCKAVGIKDRAKKKVLIKILNNTEE